jgi:ferric-dicitrate binding protein FerR (iron transport regulator)
MLAAIVPLALFADEAKAILRSTEGVLVNRGAVSHVSAILPGDTIETQASAMAHIELSGSTVDIDPGSVVEFEGDEIFLERGTVKVNSARQFQVRTSCIVVVPANPEWTSFDVTEGNGKVNVAAHKKDVNLDSRGDHQHFTQTSSAKHVAVPEGTQKSREEKCGLADMSSVSAATLGILNSPYAVGIGGAAVAGVTACMLGCFNDDPISPDSPSGKH